jgi:hypothetical protein
MTMESFFALTAFASRTMIFPLHYHVWVMGTVIARTTDRLLIRQIMYWHSFFKTYILSNDKEERFFTFLQQMHLLHERGKD